MTLSISRVLAPQLFSARQCMLVDESLLGMIPANVARAVKVFTFAGLTIGSAEDDAYVLDIDSLPPNIALIVAPTGSAFAKRLLQQLALAKMPVMPKTVFVSAWQKALGRAPATLHEAFSSILSDIIASDLYSPLRLEQDIASLRQILEQREARLDRMSILLNQVGLHSEEFTLETLNTRALTPITLPIRQDLANSLHNLRCISVFKTSPAVGQVELIVSIQGRAEYSATLEAPPGRGWLDLFLPESLVTSVHRAQIEIRSLRGNVTLAGHRSTGMASLRFAWDEASARDDLTSRTILAAAKPLLLSSHGADGQKALVAGCWLEAGSRLSLAACWSGTGKAPALTVLLVPHGLAPASDQIRHTVHADSFGKYDLQIGPTTTAGRYDVKVSRQTAKAVARGEIEWSRIQVISGRQTPFGSYASARFASLHSAVTYCDGPVFEQALNSQYGFPVVSVSDGNAFMQTHPVAERIVGAKLVDFVPVGTYRMWLDIANAHPGADTIEFIVLMLRDEIEEQVQAWLLGQSLPEYDALSILDLEDQGILVRATMSPGSETTLDITLPAPLTFQGQLYCLVNAIGRSNRYGWCRWNAVGFAIDANYGLPITL